MLSAALKSPGRWNPKRLGPSLALWIDPSDIATMFQSNAGTTTVTDGSVCGYAGDKSGNAFDLSSAADDTTRPTWNNNGGLPYLNFDGTNDLLRRTSALGLYAAVTVSIFAAVRANPALGSHLCGDRSSATSTPSYVFRADATTATTGELFIRNDASTSLSLTTPSITNAFDNTDNVVGLTDNGAGSQVGYVDGAQTGTGSVSQSGALTVDRFALGGTLTTAPTSFMATRVYGLVIVKRVLTAGEIASLTTYLGAKMGKVL